MVEGQKLEIVDRGLFKAKSGVWWMNNPIREGYASSLHIKDEAKARAKYEELMAFYRRCYVV